MRSGVLVLTPLLVTLFSMGCATLPEEPEVEKKRRVLEETAETRTIPDEARIEQKNLVSSEAVVRGAAAHRLGKNTGTALYLVQDLISLLDDTAPLMFYRDKIITVEEAPKSGYYPGPRLTSPQKIAIQTLIKLGAIASNHLETTLLQDQKAIIRRSAAEILGTIGDKNTLPTLLEALLKDLNPDVRSACVSSLGKLSERRALFWLKLSLEDESALVRMRAGEAIVSIDKVEAYNANIQLLKDPDQYVRGSAARILGDIGSRDAVPALVKTYHWKNMGFESDNKAAEEMIRAIGKLKDPSGFEAIIPALDHPVSTEIRVAAIKASQKIGWDPSVQEKIRKLSSDPDTTVRRAAIVSLAKDADPEDFGIFTRAISDRDDKIRYWSAAGLMRIGDTRAITTILDAFPEKNSMVSGSYVKALRKLTGEELGYKSGDWIDRLRNEYGPAQ